MGGEMGGENGQQPLFHTVSGPLDVATLDLLLKMLGDVITVSGGGLAIAACVSAWKKDPVGGVIGVQKGPLW